ncbi:unnamed protein product [Paramecium octaurelia]|uniref:Uncharacterized protein n=1 Tax=Paramecium octaurelia TaxID=43137 RepID=A0A8S1X6Q9_PAROT|nr:unnamed protein product [Paramecium octaurelia]
MGRKENIQVKIQLRGGKIEENRNCKHSILPILIFKAILMAAQNQLFNQIYKPQMMEKVKDFICSMKHQLPISMVVLDHKCEQNKRLLCRQCFGYQDSDVKKVEFEKLIQTIEDDKKIQLENLETMIEPMIKKIQSLLDHLYTLKNFLVLNQIKLWTSHRIGYQIYNHQVQGYKNIITMNQKSNESDQIYQNNVLTLSFMKKSKQFILGDEGGSIIIWSSNNNNQWNCSQTIQAHNKSIRYLILNNKEDLFISSSADETIKFWVKQNDWICSQTITDHNDNDNIYQLSLIIKKIKLFLYSELNKKWIVIQNIKVEEMGYRICFINNNQFIFQPAISNLMHVCEINNISKQFAKTKDIVVNQYFIRNSGGLFPQQIYEIKIIISEKLINLKWSNLFYLTVKLYMGK